jgi:plasmid stability protein
MLEACYDHAVSAIQVKNVPDELHEALRQRASAEGVPVGEIVLRALRTELRRATFREWSDTVARRVPRPDPETRARMRAVIEEERRDRRAGW